MKTIVAALIASTFLIGSAFAQSPAASSVAMARSADAKHSAEIEKHIKDLHARLKITPAEEAQWDAVAQTMRGNASELDSAIEKRASIANNATAIDDLNAYGDIVQAHADAIKKLSEAFSSLYSSMPDEQKKLADNVFAQRAHEGKKVASR
jgi:protein CpxP